MQLSYDGRYRGHIARILYVFAETNPGLSYVQGMHDVACVIFHVFFLSMEAVKLRSARRSTEKKSRQQKDYESVLDVWQCKCLSDVEADTYAAFSRLIFQMRDLLPNNHRGWYKIYNCSLSSNHFSYATTQIQINYDTQCK